jgi:hypothetical protein
MKKTIAAFVILFALILGYVAWPFVSLFAVVRAAEAGDTAAIEQRVNFPALRRSVSAQVIGTYARLTGMKTDGAGLTVGIAASFADPFIEKLLSPAALADLLRGAWPKTVVSDGLPGGGAIDLSSLTDALRLYWYSDYGIGEVRIHVPADQPKEKRFRVELALNNWVWKLNGLGLPVDLQERLARELMKQQGKTG